MELLETAAKAVQVPTSDVFLGSPINEPQMSVSWAHRPDSDVVSVCKKTEFSTPLTTAVTCLEENDDRFVLVKCVFVSRICPPHRRVLLPRIQVSVGCSSLTFSGELLCWSGNVCVLKTGRPLSSCP